MKRIVFDFKSEKLYNEFISVISDINNSRKAEVDVIESEDEINIKIKDING